MARARSRRTAASPRAATTSRRTRPLRGCSRACAHSDAATFGDRSQEAHHFSLRARPSPSRAARARATAPARTRRGRGEWARHQQKSAWPAGGRPRARRRGSPRPCAAREGPGLLHHVTPISARAPALLGGRSARRVTRAWVPPCQWTRERIRCHQPAGPRRGCRQGRGRDHAARPDSTCLRRSPSGLEEEHLVDRRRAARARLVASARRSRPVVARIRRSTGLSACCHSSAIACVVASAITGASRARPRARSRGSSAPGYPTRRGRRGANRAAMARRRARDDGSASRRARTASWRNQPARACRRAPEAIGPLRRRTIRPCRHRSRDRVLESA